MEPMDIRAPDRKKGFLSGVFFFLSLSDLLHEAAHGGSRLVLLLASGVGVGAQGETGVWPSMEETVFTSTPFCRAVVAKV